MCAADRVGLTSGQVTSITQGSASDPCGWYDAVSNTANGAQVELEPGPPRFTDVLPEPPTPTDSLRWDTVGEH